MTIEKYIPTGPLSEFVDAINYLSGDIMGTGVAFPRMHQVLIINLGSNFTTSEVYNLNAGIEELSSQVWINGSHDSPFMLGSKGPTSMYAVSIKLGMLQYFVKMPASETHDQTVDALNWNGSDMFFLREQLFDCSTIREGFLLIEKYLLDLIRGNEFTALTKINWLREAIYVNSVNEICQSLGVTRKKLRSDSFQYFGTSVKHLQGVIRFNHTLATIAQRSQESLSTLHEFYDQSHFISDFKARTGITPKQYKRLCQEFPYIKYTPNFIALNKETYLKLVAV